MELKATKRNITINLEAIGGYYRELSGNSASSFKFIGKDDYYI